jgi:hypothetical protein
MLVEHPESAGRGGDVGLAQHTPGGVDAGVSKGTARSSVHGVGHFLGHRLAYLRGGVQTRNGVLA